MNSYYEIHFETNFKKEIVKEWLKDEMYECKDLLKNIKIKHMQIYERVIVKKINYKRVNKIART